MLIISCTSHISESKLSKLSKQVVSSHSSKGDSGYASNSTNNSYPSQNTYQGLGKDQFWEEGEPEDQEEEEEEGGYGSGVETEEDSRAGEGLLWRSKSRRHRSSEVSEDESNVSGISTEHETPSGSSPSQLVVIPPTPTTLAPDVLDRLPYRIPSAFSDSNPARRISFNSSVRISGGIRTSSHSHYHSQQSQSHSQQFSAPTLAITQDLFSPTRPKSDHLHIRSRSTSPSRSPQPLSTSSSYRSPSTLQNYPSAANLRSTSGPSSIQSRSSSPCSSIYAPLHAPSNTVPSPAFIKSLPSNLNQNKKSLTFAEYLLGQTSSGSNSHLNSISTEESYRGYRKVLAEQAKRKKEEKQILRDNLVWWERIIEMLGAASGSRKGSSGVGVGVGVGVAAAASQSRDYGTMNTRIEESGNGVAVEEENISSSRGRGKTRGQPVRRTSSMLSVSSAGDIDSEDDGSEIDIDSERLIANRVEKTEADFIFGVAPRRWFRIDWIIWKLSGLLLWLKNEFKKLFRFSREDQVEEQAYQRV